MTPAQLRFTQGLWRATLSALAPYRGRRVEGGCLWYGRRHDVTAHATLVGIPKQVNRPRNFEIPPDALAELNRRVPDGMIVVAQVHSHPGGDTTHSPWDNDMMVSRKVFSLVLPFYGTPPCELSSVGVHVHDGAHWVKLQGHENLRRLIVEPDGAVESRIRVVDAR